MVPGCRPASSKSANQPFSDSRAEILPVASTRTALRILHAMPAADAHCAAPGTASSRLLCSSVLTCTALQEFDEDDEVGHYMSPNYFRLLSVQHNAPIVDASQPTSSEVIVLPALPSIEAGQPAQHVRYFPTGVICGVRYASSVVLNDWPWDVCMQCPVLSQRMVVCRGYGGSGRFSTAPRIATRSTLLSSYASVVPCSVLTWRTLISAYARAMRCPVQDVSKSGSLPSTPTAGGPIRLRAGYAACVTDLAYPAISLCGTETAACAVCGTELACGGVQCALAHVRYYACAYAVLRLRICGTELAYGAGESVQAEAAAGSPSVAAYARPMRCPEDSNHVPAASMSAGIALRAPTRCPVPLGTGSTGCAIVRQSVCVPGTGCAVVRPYVVVQCVQQSEESGCPRHSVCSSDAGCAVVRRCVCLYQAQRVQ
eukprot:3373787-Rhodomonas_salina.3